MTSIFQKKLQPDEPDGIVLDFSTLETNAEQLLETIPRLEGIENRIELAFSLKNLASRFEEQRKQLERLIDIELRDRGIRIFVTNGGIQYTFSEVAGSFTIDGEKLLPIINSAGINWEEVYKKNVDNNKVADLINAGALSGDAVSEITTQSEGHMKHFYKFVNSA